MKALFYPGCSMQKNARPYLDSLLAIREDIDLELQEVEDWNCCGATEYMSVHRVAAHSLQGFRARQLHQHPEFLGIDATSPKIVVGDFAGARTRFTRDVVVPQQAARIDIVTLGQGMMGRAHHLQFIVATDFALQAGMIGI